MILANLYNVFITTSEEKVKKHFHFLRVPWVYTVFRSITTSEEKVKNPFSFSTSAVGIYPKIFCKTIPFGYIIQLWTHTKKHAKHVADLLMVGNAISATWRQKSTMTCMDAEGIIAWASVRNVAGRKQSATVRRVNNFASGKEVFAPFENF